MVGCGQSLFMAAAISGDFVMCSHTCLQKRNCTLPCKIGNEKWRSACRFHAGISPYRNLAHVTLFFKLDVSRAHTSLSLRIYDISHLELCRLRRICTTKFRDRITASKRTWFKIYLPGNGDRARRYV